MTSINIVSTDSPLCRLLELEMSRMGAQTYISPTPVAECPVCLMDADTCFVPPPSPQTVLILLGKSANKQLTDMARVHLEKPLLLEELRKALVAVLSPTTIPQKKMVWKRPSPSKGARHPLVIHHKARTASVGTHSPVKLSETEYKLLCRLREYGKKPLSADDVQDILGESDSNKFNVYICYLRRKLERGEIRVIHTVRGKGYTLYPQERN